MEGDVKRKGKPWFVSGNPRASGSQEAPTLPQDQQLQGACLSASGLPWPILREHALRSVRSVWLSLAWSSGATVQPLAAGSRGLWSTASEEVVWLVHGE